MYQECDHPQDQLKYFKNDDKIICLKCGKVWPKEISNTWPPYTPHMPYPDTVPNTGDPIPYDPSRVWCSDDSVINVTYNLNPYDLPTSISQHNSNT